MMIQYAADIWKKKFGHLAYLYPLAETVISDPTIWVGVIWQPTILNILKKELTEESHQICASKVQQAIRTAFTQL